MKDEYPEEITLGDVMSLTGLKFWLQNYRHVHGILPATIDEWREKLTEESYEEYGREMVLDVQSEEHNSNENSVNIRLSDYPEFSGKHEQ